MSENRRNSKAVKAVAFVVLVFALTMMGFAQETGGEAEIGFQGSYFDNGAGLHKTSGTALHYREFLPSIGLLEANFQGYSDNGGFATGENYLDLQNVIWNGRSWSFRGGDFSVSPYAVHNPFNNVFIPYVTSRGGRVEMADSNRTVGVFFGNVTLPEGSWIPLREAAPQNSVGAYFVQKLGDRINVGARFTRLSSSSSGIAERPYLFTSPLATQSSNGLTFDIDY